MASNTYHPTSVSACRINHFGWAQSKLERRQSCTQALGRVGPTGATEATRAHKDLTPTGTQESRLARAMHQQLTCIQVPRSSCHPDRRPRQTLYPHALDRSTAPAKHEGAMQTGTLLAHDFWCTGMRATQMTKEEESRGARGQRVRPKRHDGKTRGYQHRRAQIALKHAGPSPCKRPRPRTSMAGIRCRIQNNGQGGAVGCWEQAQQDTEIHMQIQHAPLACTLSSTAGVSSTDQVACLRRPAQAPPLDPLPRRRRTACGGLGG